MNLKDLNDARTKALAEARSYVDKEDTPETQVAYQRAFDEFLRLDRLVNDERKMAKAEAEAAEARAEIEDIVTPKEVRASEHKHETEVREFLTPGSERKLLFIPVPDKRTTGTIVSDDGGAGAYGSYSIPATWWPSLYYHVNAESGVLASNCTVIRTAGGNDIDITALSTDASAVHTAQGSAATETIPVFGQKILRSHRMDGFFSVAKEFLDDTALDSLSMLQNLANRAIATLVSGYAASGTGSGEPAGLNYNTTEPTTLGKTAAAQTTFTSDEIMDLYLSVAKSSRMRGEFVAGTTAYGIMLKWKDDEGRYLVTNPTASEAPSFMGKAIREDAGYQATTTGLVPVTFGDMTAYWVRWSRGLEFTRDDSFAFSKFQSTFRFAAWYDSILLDTLAVKHLLMA
jgi:HK97 family phage major capsid protein